MFLDQKGENGVSFFKKLIFWEKIGIGPTLRKMWDVKVTFFVCNSLVLFFVGI